MTDQHPRRTLLKATLVVWPGLFIPAEDTSAAILNVVEAAERPKKPSVRQVSLGANVTLYANADRQTGELRDGKWSLVAGDPVGFRHFVRRPDGTIFAATVLDRGRNRQEKNGVAVEAINWGHIPVNPQGEPIPPGTKEDYLPSYPAPRPDGKIIAKLTPHTQRGFVSIRDGLVHRQYIGAAFDGDPVNAREYSSNRRWLFAWFGGRAGGIWGWAEAAYFRPR